MPPPPAAGPAVRGASGRLLRAGLAYQLPDLAAKAIALGLLPLYTRRLSPADYGTTELLLSLVILGSIVIRVGLGEALVRFHFHDEDPVRRARAIRSTVLVVGALTTAIALAAALAAGPLSQLLLGADRPDELRAATLGLWAFTNLEVAYAALRMQERVRDALLVSIANVALTVTLTLVLVLGSPGGAVGLLLGNFGATAIVLVALWCVGARHLGLAGGLLGARALLARLRFGLPTVPADAAVFALFVIDRLYLYRVASDQAAGRYALAVKLAGVIAIAVRGFQLAWPPLAYSIADDGAARRLYARVATWYVLLASVGVAGLLLLGRWLVRALAGPDFQAAHRALPWVGLGWALYGLYLILVAVAGRAHATVRTVPAALAGLVVNVVLLAALVGPLGIAGAGLALVGACAVMLLVAHLLLRRVFPVPFEWGRIATVVAAVAAIAAAGELALPTGGAAGLASRAAALAAVAAVVALHAGAGLAPAERARLRSALRAARPRPRARAAARG